MVYLVASFDWYTMLENIVDNWVQWLILCWLSYAFCYRGVSEKVGQSGRVVFEAIAGMLAIVAIFILLTNGRGCTPSETLRYDADDSECVPAGPGIYGC